MVDFSVTDPGYGLCLSYSLSAIKKSLHRSHYAPLVEEYREKFWMLGGLMRKNDETSIPWIQDHQIQD